MRVHWKLYPTLCENLNVHIFHHSEKIVAGVIVTCRRKENPTRLNLAMYKAECDVSRPDKLHKEERSMSTLVSTLVSTFMNS